MSKSSKAWVGRFKNWIESATRPIFRTPLSRPWCSKPRRWRPRCGDEALLVSLVADFVQGTHRRVDHKSRSFKESESKSDGFRGRKWIAVACQHAQVTAGKWKSPCGLRGPGCGGDMRSRGINRRPQGFADVGQSLPQFVFQLGLLDA